MIEVSVGLLVGGFVGYFVGCLHVGHVLHKNINTFLIGLGNSPDEIVKAKIREKLISQATGLPGSFFKL